MTHEFPVPLSETYIDKKTGKKIALYETERREPYLKNVHHPPVLKKLILDCLRDLPDKRPTAMNLIEVIHTIEPELEKKQLMFEVHTPICILLSILSLTICVEENMSIFDFCKGGDYALNYSLKVARLKFNQKIVIHVDKIPLTQKKRLSFRLEDFLVLCMYHYCSSENLAIENFLSVVVLNKN